LAETSAQLLKLTQTSRNYETEVEELQQRLRARESELEHTKELYRSTLENFAIATTELEAMQDSKLEDTQRLKDRLAEVTQELISQKRSDIKPGHKPMSLSLVEALIQRVSAARLPLLPLSVK
jgi:predicted nuclease with TOPRIM domain